MTGWGYPETPVDETQAFLDRFRCEAVEEGRRCQLYDRHDDAHAHAELVSAKPWQTVRHRWDDEGARWVDDDSKRLRWCCMLAN